MENQGASGVKKFMRRWGAVVILFLMFFGSWIGQFFAQSAMVMQEAQTHGETFTWDQFTPEFWSATLENWQSEFLQLAVQTLLIASWWQVYVFQADHSADKDDVKQINGKLDQLLERQTSDGTS